MYDIAPWFGVVNMFLSILILAIVVTGFMLWRLGYLFSARNEDAIATPGSPKYVLSVGNLSFELKTVTANWYQLGVNLDLPTCDLNKIKRDYHGSNEQMLHTLDLWLRSMPTASWGGVVSALRQMGENVLADSIHQKCIRGTSKSKISFHSSRVSDWKTK